jgi:hypothetical protein
MNDDPRTLWNDLVRLPQPTLEAMQERCTVWHPSSDENDRTIYLGQNLVLEAEHPLQLRRLLAASKLPAAGAVSHLVLVVSPTRYPHDSRWAMHLLPNYSLCGVPIHVTAAEFLAGLQSQGRAADAVSSTLIDIHGRKALLLCIGKSLQIEFRADDEISPRPTNAIPYTIAFAFNGTDHIDPYLT